MNTITQADRKQAVQGLTLMAFAYAFTVPSMLVAQFVFQPLGRTDFQVYVLANVIAHTVFLLLPAYGMWLLREFASRANTAIAAASVVIGLDAIRTWLIAELLSGAESGLLGGQAIQVLLGCISAIAEAWLIYTSMRALRQTTTLSGGRSSKPAMAAVCATLLYLLLQPLLTFVNIASMTSSKSVMFNYASYAMALAVMGVRTAALTYLAYRARQSLCGMLLEPEISAESAYRGATELR
jgi:hypothetical protein